jgi:hypothetical protein
MSPLHYLSGRSNFGFEFAEIFVNETRLPAITDTGSRRLSVSLIHGVGDSPFSFDFQYFKRLKHAFKGLIWPKISQGCIVLSQ